MNNKDGLRYPSIDALLEKIPSKYQLAFTSAKRAKIINAEDGYSSMEKMGGNECYTAIGKALEEILNDKVHVEFMDTAEDADTNAPQAQEKAEEVAAEEEPQEEEFTVEQDI